MFLSFLVTTDTPEKLADDWELKWWREELVKPRNSSGVGLQNVPGSDKDGKCGTDDRDDVSLYSTEFSYIFTLLLVT